MSYVVLARKWRPKTFDEVVGQPVITRTLRNAIEQGRLAQAYLFSGTRGVGKTTMARILAKSVNCEKGPTAKPCGACAPCVEITAGTALDVLEMDAASHNGVDDIRRLQEHLVYRGSLRYKVVILDEVHMLSTAANNAFLKTLEEPPPGVLFILATTEPHKLEETVVSRCQHFVFRRIDEADILKHLRSIADAENIAVSDTALDLIIRHCEGSMRDAVVALDQLVAFVGTKISDADAAAAIGAVGREYLHALMGAVVKEDHAEILSLIRRLAAEGASLDRLMGEWMWYLREVLVLKSVEKPEDFIHLSKRDVEAMRALAASWSEAELLRAVEVTARAERDMRFSRQPRFLVEAAFLKMAHLRRLTPIEQVLSEIKSGGGTSGAVGSGGDESARATATGSAKNTAPRSSDMAEAAPPLPLPQGLSVVSITPVKTVVPREKPPAPPPEENAEKAFLDFLWQDRPALAAAVGHAVRWEWSGDGVRLLFSRRNVAVKESLAGPRAGDLSECLQRHFGKPMRASFDLLDPTDGDVEAMQALSEDEFREERMRDEALSEPLVQRALDIFKGRVMSVEKLD